MIECVGPDETALARRGESGPAGIVTILFSDLVGSTELLERVGDDASEALRRTHFGLLREAVASHAGTEVKNLGDGLMVVFGSAVDALECAAAMQKAVSRYNRRAAERMSVRVGVHVGEPIVDESDYFGTPVVVAKRLCDRAEGGQVLVSDLVRALVGGHGALGFRHLEPLSLKGSAEPMMASELIWDMTTPGEHPPLPTALVGPPEGFVGRDGELAELRRALRTASSGRCRVVFIAGEPGIGKTTLASQVAAEAHAGGALVLFGRCDEESLVAYQPIIEALTSYLGLGSERDLADRLGGYAADLALLLPVLNARIPGLPGPTGAANERWRLFEAFAGLLAHIAAEVTLVLVLDDLHWADRPTLQLLQHAIRKLTDARLLILGTYRDTDLARTHPMADTLADLRRAGMVERLALRGLAEDDVLRMVASTEEPLPAELELATALWSETEGSPLFVREILRHLEETEAVIRTDGGWRPQRRIDQLGIPDGVREVIGRRLNRLSDEANAVLHVGAVLGREFDLDVLERVSGMSTDALLDAVDDACASGILSEAPGGVGRYSFTHALVRRALYDELSLSRRVRLDRRVGEALDELHAGSSRRAPG